MPEDIIVNIEGMNVVIKDAKLKIGIGISAGNNISPEFLKALFARYTEWTKIYAISMIIDTVIPLDLSRNNIVEAAKKENCDYLFFIDSDVLIEQGQLERLLSHGKDAISGIYYQKRNPYSPLPRKRVSENLYVALELQGNDIVEVDATGMGCFLMKMDIFEKLSYPWFEFKYSNNNGKWIQLSEDFHFCQNLQSAGIKIYCDPIVQCGHIGAIVEPRLARVYKTFRVNSEKERDMTALEVSEFANISISEVYDRWKFAAEAVAEDYRRFISQNHKELKDFYKANKNYIFNLTNLHMTQRRGIDLELIKSIKEKNPIHSAWDIKKILDYGSGCGQNAIELADAGYDVSMADYDSYTSEFARFRAKKRGLSIKFYDIEKPINEKFDIILALDVLDHIPDDEFKDTVELLRHLKRDGGKILTTVNFGNQGGLYPMRYQETPEKFALLEKLQDDNILI